MKKKMILGSMLLGVSVIALSSCSFDLVSRPASFEELYNEVNYTLIIGTDKANVNQIFDDPTAYGISKSSLTLTPRSYTSISSIQKTLSKSIVNSYYKYLLSYENEIVTKNDKIKYYTLKKNLELYKTLLESNNNLILLQNEYISSDGGEIGTILTTVTNYSYETKTDIDDIIKYLKLCSSAIPTYKNFLKDRINAGYPLSDYELDQMKLFLDDIVNNGSKWFLYDYIYSQINKVSEIEDKEDYKVNATTAIDNMLVAIKELSESLAEYKGHITDTSKSIYTYYGEGGKEFLDYLYQTKIGTTLTVTEYKDLVISESKKASTELANIKNELNESEKTELDNLLKTGYYDNDPDKILNELREISSEMFYPLQSNPTITVKEIDESYQKVASFLAYYMVSAVDRTGGNEYVTLNPLGIKDTNNLLFTLAHEGYPGHLYDHNIAKENGLGLENVLGKNLSVKEGWAQYSTGRIFDYLAEKNSDNKVLSTMFKYYKQYEYAGYMKTEAVEVCANYFGYTATDLVNEGLAETEADAKAKIAYVMDKPFVHSSYSYGWYAWNECYNTSKSLVGYNDKDYHKYMLTSFPMTITGLYDYNNKYAKTLSIEL